MSSPAACLPHVAPTCLRMVFVGVLSPFGLPRQTFSTMLFYEWLNCQHGGSICCSSLLLFSTSRPALKRLWNVSVKYRAAHLVVIALISTVSTAWFYGQQILFVPWKRSRTPPLSSDAQPQQASICVDGHELPDHHNVEAKSLQWCRPAKRSMKWWKRMENVLLLCQIQPFMLMLSITWMWF